MSLRGHPAGTTSAAASRCALAVLCAAAIAQPWPCARAAPVVAEGPLSFDAYLLELPGKVELTYYEDIDGDGLTDVLAIVASADPDLPPRDLVVYFQRKDGFSAQPDVRLRVPDRVAVIDLGDVIESVPGKELLMLDGQGVWWVPLTPSAQGDSASAAVAAQTSGAPSASPQVGSLLVAVDPVLAHSDPDKLQKYDFARSVDKARRATLFIPRTEGYRVFYPDDNYAEGQDIAVEHVHRIDQDGSYRVRPASIQLADFDGDGHEDMAVTHLDNVVVHLQRSGRFDPQPGITDALRILTDVDREAAEGVDALLGFKLADFDKDGLADIFVWKTVVQKKAVIHDKQQYQLYRNRGGRFDAVPDQAFVLKSFDAATVADLDGDGRPDLVTGYFEFSVGNIIKALLTKKFSIDLNFFLANEHGFPDKPAETRDFKIRFSLSNLDETFAPAVQLDKDFDGNGVVDFLLQTEDERVDVFLGQPASDQLFEKKASVHLRTPACERHFVDDMNGDGLADMAFDHFPEREPFKTNWINVVLSRR